MTPYYKHTQIGYLMIVVTLIVLTLFIFVQIVARSEPPSIDSGSNFFVTVIMFAIIFILTQFSALTVSINEKYLKIKFGYSIGIFKKRFPIEEIVSVKTVKNSWYYGWGIRLWFWPYMWIYNVSGFDAVEIIMNNGSIYRIGTDAPEELVNEIIKRLKK